jgi:hypothetical protein
LYGHAGLGLVGGDELDDGAYIGEGSASPVQRDQAEEAMLDLVPFGGAERVVADGDGQPGVDGQAGQVVLSGM